MTARIKMLVTRPLPDALRTADHLQALSIAPVIAPMLEPVAEHDSLPDPKDIAAIAFTSINGVRFFAARNPDPLFLTKPVYAVGEATADAARETGFKTVFAAEGTLDDLTRLIAQTHRAGTIFYPHARDLSGDLAASLAPYGIEVIGAKLYAMDAAMTLPPDIENALLAGEIAGALFFSARTAEAFSALLNRSDFSGLKTGLHCLCLSEKCAAPLIKNHFSRIALADQPSHEAMMVLALAFTRDQIRA